MPLEIDVRTLGALNQEHREPVGDDTRGQAITCQLTGTFVGTISFEQSQDGTNWVACQMTNAASASGTAPVTSATAPGLFTGTVPARFWRARMSAYTSGTATSSAAILNLGAALPNVLPAVAASPPNSVRHVLLSAVTTNITGTAVDEGTSTYVSMRNKHTVQVVLGGTVATGTLTVQGSLDAVAFVDIPGLVGVDLVAGPKILNFEGVFRSYRAVVAGLTGTTPTVTAYLGSTL